MISTKRSTTSRIRALVFTMTLALCGPMLVSPPVQAGFFQDNALAVKVSSKLQFNKKLWQIPIQVDVHEGVVMLSGNVPSQAIINEALKTVRGVEGVKGVQNFLKVGPPVHEQAPQY